MELSLPISIALGVVFGVAFLVARKVLRSSSSSAYYIGVPTGENQDLENQLGESFTYNAIVEQPVVALHVRKEVHVFLDMLHKYLDCRKKMDAKYRQIDELQTLANFTFANKGPQKKPTGKQKKKPKCAYGESFSKTTPHIHPEYSINLQQQSIHGQPAKHLNQLYDAAGIAHAKFQELVEDLVYRIREACGDDDDDCCIEIDVAPLKGRDRAQEKAKNNYSKRKPGPAASWLYDIVRGSIKLASTEQVRKCLELLEKQEQEGGPVPFRIVKAKNRFHSPTLTGYRDFNVCLQLTIPTGTTGGIKTGSFQHICELQIHHQAIKALSIELDSHKQYEYFRSYFAGSTDSLTERLEDLEMIGNGSALDVATLSKLVNESTNEEQLDRLHLLFREYLCDFQLAQLAGERLLEVQLERVAPDDSLVAKTYSDLGAVLDAQGKHDKAMDLFKKALEIDLKVLGFLHPVVAARYGNMGLVLEAQGKYDEAMTMHNKAVEIYLQTVGLEHLDVAMMYNNMGTVLVAQGKYHEAMDMFHKALGIESKTLGSVHSLVATRFNNMGVALEMQGRYDEAMAMYTNALEIQLKTLGSDHSDVATTFNNMGLVLRVQGKFNEAMGMFNKSLEIELKTLGPDHSDVATTYGNMAVVLYRQGKLNKSLAMYNNTLEIKLRTLGPNHPHVTSTYDALDIVLKKLGRTPKSRKTDSKKRAACKAKSVLGRTAKQTNMAPEFNSTLA